MTVYKYGELDVAKPDPTILRRHVCNENVMLVIFDFVSGPIAPPHHHPHEQITYIAEGKVNFIVGEGDTRTVDLVEAGDMIVVPPGEPHTVEVLSEEARLVDCFYPIREDFL